MPESQKKLILALALLLLFQSVINMAKYAGEIHTGARFGGDFISFHSAAQAAVEGNLPGIYRTAELDPVKPEFTFIYPPHAMPLLAPIGALTYNQAVTLWTLFWLATYYGLVFLLLKRETARQALPLTPKLMIIGFAILLPLVMANMFSGQWGAAIATFFLMAYLGWRKNPLLAGIGIGLMTVKPHLAILFFVALLVSRQWRTMAIALATAAVMFALSAAWLGLSLWPDYAYEASLTKQFLTIHAHFDQLAIAPYISLQSIGLPVSIASAVQTLITASVIFAVAQVFYKQRGENDLRFALLACGALLATPYSLCYDTPLLAVAILPMLTRAWKNGFSSGAELAAFTAILLTPYAQPLLFVTFHIPFGLFAVLFLFAVTYRNYLKAR